MNEEDDFKYLGSSTAIKSNCGHKDPDGYYFVDRVEYKQLGNMVTPSGRTQEILCLDCFHGFR